MVRVGLSGGLAERGFAESRFSLVAFVDLARGETNRHVPGASPAVAPAVHIKLTLPGRSSGVKAGGASAAFGAPYVLIHGCDLTPSKLKTGHDLKFQVKNFHSSYP